MKLEEEIFGLTPEGIQIKRYRLSNRADMMVSVMSFGAILTSVRVPNRMGKIDDIVLGFDTLDDYLTDVWFLGATIGRYANRIAQGRFALDGVQYQLAQNSPPSHLHGGNKGFHKVVWIPEPHVRGDSIGVTFSYLSKEGEEGYPGNLSVQVTYTLNEANELTLGYEATTDQTTPINLTNHTYWNLRGVGSGRILDHELHLNADCYLPTDEHRIPTGELRPVSNTVMDFRSAERIGGRIAQVTGGGYNHCYVLNKKGDPLSLAARVREPHSGRMIEMHTTEPGVHFYTGHFLDGYRGACGIIYNKYDGFCLEAQHFPNSVNIPHFPSTLLRPGEVYRQTTTFKFLAA